MSAAQHTPGPWAWRKADRILGCDARGQHYIHAKDRTIAAMLDSEQEANAQRIVQCVNAHDQLVEALRHTRHHLLDSHWFNEHHYIIRHIDAAIAKATGSSS